MPPKSLDMEKHKRAGFKIWKMKDKISTWSSYRSEFLLSNK